MNRLNKILFFAILILAGLSSCKDEPETKKAGDVTIEFDHVWAANDRERAFPCLRASIVTSTSVGAWFRSKNLENSIAGETHEFTHMYPEFVKLAEAEGKSDAVYALIHKIQTETLKLNCNELLINIKIHAATRQV